MKPTEFGKKNMKTLMALDPEDPRAQEVMSKICIPHATSLAGKQEGVKPPWAVDYPKSQKGVKPGSGDEAIRKYRTKIASGAPAFPVESKDVQIGENDPDEIDPFTTDNKTEPAPAAKKKRAPRAAKPIEKKADANLDAALAYLKILAEKEESGGETTVQYETREPDYDRLDRYLRNKVRVAMKMENGTIRMTVAAVIQDDMSITIIMPTDNDGFTYTPDPGSKFTLSWDGKMASCYYPGTQFEVPELGFMGLVFMSNKEDDVRSREAKRPSGPDNLGASIMKHVKQEPRLDEVVKFEDSKPIEDNKKYKYNPETGFMEDEFGLVKV